MNTGQKNRYPTKAASQAQTGTALPSSRPWSSLQTNVNSPPQPRHGNGALVPVYVLPENLLSVQQFVLSLGQPIFPSPALGQDPFLQFDGFDTTASSHDENQEVDDFDQYDSLDELSSNLSHMSITNLSVPSTPTASRHGPSPLTSSLSPASTQNNNKKYYAIVAGKKTGVFWENWYDVESLVKGVSGCIHKSFTTYEDALAYYLRAKSKNQVRIIRNPGDDALYGPRSEAML